MSVRTTAAGNEPATTPMDLVAPETLFTDQEIPPAHKPKWLPTAWSIIATADAVGLAVPTLIVSNGGGALLAADLLSLLLFHRRGLYRSRLHLSLLDDLPVLMSSSITAGLTVGVGATLMGLPPGLESFVALAVLGVLCQLVLRGAAYEGLRWGRSRGYATYTTLIVGGGRVAKKLATSVQTSPSYGLQAIGFLDDNPMYPNREWGIPHLGAVSELHRVVRDYHVAVVIVSFSSCSESRIAALLRAGGDRLPCDVFLVPRLFDVYVQEGTDHIGAVPVVRFRRPNLRGLAWKLKRLGDIAISGVSLVVLAPLLLSVAGLVRREGGPEVLFRQSRIGLNGRAFSLLKFRSLKPQTVAEAETTWSVAQDERVGPIGRFIRRTSIDELPQLWNILRGDMSLVGPRPERPHFVRIFSSQHAEYALRHRVPAGLTGLAQVHGLRGNTSIEDRIRFDNYYIEHWSLWLDAKIIFATVREVILARGR